MPVPARKKSEASGRRRRSHDALGKKVLSTCTQCSAPVKPHNACLSCGFYRGRNVLSTAKTAKATAKIVESRAAGSGSAGKAQKKK